MLRPLGEQVKYNRDYPNILRGLFPGHPARRLLCTSVQPDESGSLRKRVRTIAHGAHLTDYSKHLEVQSYDGPGALGVIPTFPEAVGARSRWFVGFLTLDFDTVALTDVRPLVTVLEGYRVHAYLDQGTTRRGVHLYVFLSEPLPQREAHEVVATIANLSKHLELTYPEHMPSSAYEPGKGIFLPYWGAAEDGLGANPLIDPLDDVQISLDAVEEEVFWTEVSDFRVFAESLSGTEGERKAIHQPSCNPSDTSTYRGASEAWDAEITRLKELWIASRRQNLTLGATAYGISLGITADRIRKGIETLERSSSDPEAADRLRAVDGTVERHVKGRRIAWRKFYALAGVEPPRANKVVPWEVALRLQVLEDRLRGVPFNGMGGFTDLDVLESLSEIGRKYGRLHRIGVEVSISVRDLALEARTSKDTILKSLKRLMRAGWIERSNHGPNMDQLGSLTIKILAPA